MKEDVLKIEFKEIWDNKYVWKIIYQNDDVFLRNDFSDKKLKVYSYLEPEYSSCEGKLYIRGLFRVRDDKINVCNEEEKKEIEEKVKLINEKYGIEKRWRARKECLYYFIVGSNFYIGNDFDVRDKIDDERYNIGNYFETEKLAVEKLKEIKELLLK